MKRNAFIMIGMTLLVVPSLRADPQDASVHLQNDEKKLERMENNRDLDDAHTQKAQQEMDKGNATLLGDKNQLVKDVQHLGTVESQVSAGNKQKSLDHQSYKDAKQKYGSDDPRCVVAKQTMKQSQQAMDPLLQNRRTLKENIHDGGRLVHNDKTVLSVQKRDMDSDARYRAQDDRRIVKKEKNIADDKSEMVASTQP